MIAILLLLLQVFLGAFGMIFLRKLKETHYMVAPTYNSLFSMLTSLAIMACFEGQYNVFGAFTLSDYLVCAGCGLLTAIGVSSKVWVLHYETASRVSAFKYIECILQFLFDQFIFNAIYTGMQLTGLIIILVASVVNNILNYCSPAKQTKKAH